MQSLKSQTTTQKAGRKVGQTMNTRMIYLQAARAMTPTTTKHQIFKRPHALYKAAKKGRKEKFTANNEVHRWHRGISLSLC